MRSLIILLLMVSASELFGQTKFIAHRSHSGSDDSFSLICQDNFGMAPTYMYNLEPDTTTAIDSSNLRGKGFKLKKKSVDACRVPGSGSATEPASEPLPIPEPAIEPDTASTSDTVENQMPGNTPATPQLEPNISNGQKGTAPQPAKPAGPPAASSSHDRHDTLLWLALALAIPATGLVLLTAKRREREDENFG